MFSDTMILVAGADARDRETILQALGDQCHVVAAQTVEDALAHVSDSVDLVICDFGHTQFNGDELIRQWKSARASTPFLVLVNEQDVTTAIAAMKSGASDCVVKPIEVEQLRSAAQHVIKSAGRSENGSNRNTASRGRHPAIDIPPDTSLEDLERAAVEQALVQHHGNRTHAARTLGISVRTLQRKLKAWGMPLISFHSGSTTENFGMTPHSNGAHTPLNLISF
jgi:DNA-binding NtrC family response regulator